MELAAGNVVLEQIAVYGCRDRMHFWPPELLSKQQQYHWNASQPSMLVKMEVEIVVLEVREVLMELPAFAVAVVEVVIREPF